MSGNHCDLINNFLFIIYARQYLSFAFVLYKYYSYWNNIEYKDSLSSEGSLDEVERLFCVGRLRVKIAEQIFGHARPLEEIDSPLVSARTDTHFIWSLPNLLDFGRLLLKFSIIFPQ